MTARVAYDWFDVLRLAGYTGCTGDEIPDWVGCVWIRFSQFETARIFDAINAAGPGFRDQLDAACKLGGYEAVEVLVEELLSQGGKHVDR